MREPLVREPFESLSLVRAEGPKSLSLKTEAFKGGNRLKRDQSDWNSRREDFWLTRGRELLVSALFLISIPMSVEIKIRKGEPIERALRRLKKRLDREGVIRDVRAKRYFEKPSEVRRRKKKVAAFSAMLRARYENQ